MQEKHEAWEALVKGLRCPELAKLAKAVKREQERRKELQRQFEGHINT